MRSAPPTRAILSTTISLGPIVLPVQIFSACDEGNKIKRSEYTTAGEKVGRVPAIKDDNGDLVRLVESHEVVKNFQTENGLVALSDEEIAAVLQSGTGVSETLHFLPTKYLHDGTYQADKCYQVRPAKIARGRMKIEDQKTNKLFALMVKALREEDVFALVEVTLSGTPHYAAIYATEDDMRMVTLKYDEEIREPLPMPSFEFTEQEMTMAKTLIQFSRTEEPMELTNAAAEKIREYAEVKAKTGEIVVAQDPQETIMEAGDLLATLEAAVKAGAVKR